MFQCWNLLEFLAFIVKLPSSYVAAAINDEDNYVLLMGHISHPWPNQPYIHCVSKKVPTLASCSFDK